jgi:hypothetical protein
MALAAIAMSLAVSLLAASACAVPRSCPGGIFTETRRPGAVEAGTRPQIRRQRRVEIDFSRLRPSPDRLTLNPFPDVCVIAQRERTTAAGGGQVQWDGRVPGAQPGTVTLVVDGAVMVGTIRVGADVYEIRYLGGGVHVISDVDPSKFPGD